MPGGYSVTGYRVAHEGFNQRINKRLDNRPGVRKKHQTVNAWSGYLPTAAQELTFYRGGLSEPIEGLIICPVISCDLNMSLDEKENSMSKHNLYLLLSCSTGHWPRS